MGVALGDFQCSVLSSTSQLCDAGDKQIVEPQYIEVHVTAEMVFIITIIIMLLSAFMI